MVFSSIPPYLDPSNWHQQQNHQIIGSTSTNPLLPPLQPSGGPHPPLQPHVGPGVGSVRPGSMAERARLANIPLPEPALKCPRCESTNTKFCYFNNYSLSQPRHFCKTCRRYWTRGGALRNVPVGGGCRRNKRSSKSSSSSKSPASSERAQTNNNNNNNDNNHNNNPSSSTRSINHSHIGSSVGSMLGLPPLRFMSPLAHHHPLADGFGGDHMGLGGYGGVTPPAAEMSFQGGGGGGGEMETWRLQQFPFLSGLEQPPVTGIGYQFHSGESSFMAGGERMMRPKFSSSMLSQLASIKMEERPELNLSRQLLGNDNMDGSSEQWNKNNNDNNDNNNVPNAVNWTELSGFGGSSADNHM